MKNIGFRTYHIGLAAALAMHCSFAYTNEIDRKGADMVLDLNGFIITGFGMNSIARGIELCIGKNGKKVIIEYPFKAEARALFMRFFSVSSSLRLKSLTLKPLTLKPQFKRVSH